LQFDGEKKGLKKNKENKYKKGKGVAVRVTSLVQKGDTETLLL